MKKGETVKKILLAVAEGSPTTISSTTPDLGITPAPFTRWYKHLDRHGRYRVRQIFAKLHREKLITVEKVPRGKIKVALTKVGKRRVLKYQFEDLTIEPMKSWDKKWRMVIFDIPEDYKNARNALRSKLQELEFYQLQKSVWIYPHECRNEIDFIVEFFDISPYVRIVETNRFDGDDLIKESFKL